jgi:hypothetical protein
MPKVILNGARIMTIARELVSGTVSQHVGVNLKLCREDPEGSETCRAASRAADPVRARHQSENGKRNRPDNPAHAPRPRRRGDRITEGASEAGAISRCKSGPGKA